MKEAIQPEGLARPAAPYSPVVVSDDLVYTAGQVGFDESGQLTADDITGQTRQVFENLLACLRAAGCEAADVIKVNAYLTDLGDFPAFNEVYRGDLPGAVSRPHDGRRQPARRHPRRGRGGGAQTRLAVRAGLSATLVARQAIRPRGDLASRSSFLGCSRSVASRTCSSIKE